LFLQGDCITPEHVFETLEEDLEVWLHMRVVGCAWVCCCSLWRVPGSSIARMKLSVWLRGKHVRACSGVHLQGQMQLATQLRKP